MDVKIEESWKSVLQTEFDKPYFKSLTDFVRTEYSTRTCYPPASKIFNAFNSCPFSDVKIYSKRLAQSLTLPYLIAAIWSAGHVKAYFF